MDLPHHHHPHRLNTNLSWWMIDRLPVPLSLLDVDKQLS